MKNATFIEGFAEEFCQSYKISYDSVVKLLKKADAVKDITKMSKEDILLFLKSYHTSKKNSLKTYKLVLNKFYKYCLEKGIVKANPIDTISSGDLDDCLEEDDGLFLTEERVLRESREFLNADNPDPVMALCIYGIYKGIKLEYLVDVKSEEVSYPVKIGGRVFEDAYLYQLFQSADEMKYRYWNNPKNNMDTKIELLDLGYVIKFQYTKRQPENVKEKKSRMQKRLWTYGYKESQIYESGIVNELQKAMEQNNSLSVYNLPKEVTDEIQAKYNYYPKVKTVYALYKEYKG